MKDCADIGEATEAAILKLFLYLEIIIYKGIFGF